MEETIITAALLLFWAITFCIIVILVIWITIEISIESFHFHTTNPLLPKLNGRTLTRP